MEINSLPMEQSFFFLLLSEIFTRHVCSSKDFNGILNYLVYVSRRSSEPRHDKTNKMRVRPAKTQISLGIRPVSSESSLCAQWVSKELSFLHADGRDSDQTGWMPRLN